jgi:hypothetical protein
MGRDIVVETSIKRAVLENVPHREAFVVIRYKEEKTDHHVREGVEGHTRFTESGEATIVFERAPEDGVVLGRLELDQYGIIHKIDHSVRKHSGTVAVIPDGSITEHKLSPEVRARLDARTADDGKDRRPAETKGLADGSLDEIKLSPQVREKLNRKSESGGASGWLRLPFRPTKVEGRRPPHAGTFPEFQVDAGITYSSNKGAKGFMSVPVPPGATRVTTFRLAGETAAKLGIHMYKTSWNRSQRKSEVKAILSEEVFYAELHEYHIREQDQVLDPELDALSLVVTAAGVCEIALVAVRFE